MSSDRSPPLACWTTSSRPSSGLSLAACSARSVVVFFFSSRSRHTRCGRDWSSDVCSSDLGCGAGGVPSLPQPASEVVPDAQSVGVVGAEHAQAVGQQFLAGGRGAGGIPGLAPPAGKVVPGGQGAGVVG